MNKVLQKAIAAMLVFILTISNLSVIGQYGITYALTDSELSNQTASIKNSNVEFNAYFEGETHIKTEEANKETKLFVNIKIKDNGYLENGEIKFENVNYKISNTIENENIQSIDIENNKIMLKQLNSNSELTLEIPITILNSDNVSIDNFEKESTATFTGTYVNSDGKEDTISKTISNKLYWHGSAESSITAELTKYIPYNINETYGVLLQTKINTGIVDSTLPIKNTNITIQVPEINNQKPTSVKIVANNTKATNGEADGINFAAENYSYDSQTGIVTIDVSNQSNTISWLKNVEDEYLVNFIYQNQETYNYVTTNGLNTTSTIDSEIEVYNDVETILTKSTTLEMNTTEAKGKITDFNMTSTKYIGKGQMYANYEETIKTKKETTYTSSYTVTVNSIELTESIKIMQGKDIFIDSSDTEIVTTEEKNNPYNKNISINENIFNKILGTEGSIEIYNSSNEKIGTINKETAKDANGNYLLDITQYSQSQISLITSKPISEGNLVINVEKAISNDISYTEEQVKTFKKLITTVEVVANNNNETKTKQIELKEPETKVDLSINKTDLSTVVENENVEIRATLDTSKIEYALYENPTLKIKLPSYIEEIKLNSDEIVMSNGLTLKNVEQTEENGQIVINIELEGIQTEYTIDAEYKGTLIIINADITTKTLTPSTVSKITMDYTNNNEVSTNNSGTVEQEIKFIAPSGIVTAHGISNYAEGKDDILSISDEKSVVNITAYSEERIAKIYGKVINNYENNIGELVILGRIPVKGNTTIDGTEELGSTFDAILNSDITVSGIDSTKYTIYYSEKSDATKDLADGNTNGWTTTRTENIKSFLIVINDYEIKQGETVDFSYDVKIPSNIKHSNSTFGMYKIYYNNISTIGTIAETKKSSIMEITTGEGPELTATLKSSIDTIKEGQVVKMKVNVENTGSVAAENVKVTVTAPEYSKFVEYLIASEFEEQDITTKNINIGTLDAGESKEVSYYIKIDEMISEFEGEEEITVISVKTKAYITASNLGGKISSEEYELKITQGEISIQMISDISEDQVLKTGDVISYTIKINNISGESALENTVVTIPLPDGMKYRNAIIKETLSDSNKITSGINYNEETNTVEINIGTLNIQKVIKLAVEVEEYNGNASIMATIKSDETEENYSNIIEYSIQIVKILVGELTSTPKYVKEGEEITYKFTITNTGNALAKNIKVTNTLPEGLSFEKATYTYGDNTETFNYLTNGKIQISIGYLAEGTTVSVEIVAKAGKLPDENDKEIQNSIYVTINDSKTAQTNTVKNYIEYNSQIHQPGTEESETPTDPSTPETPSTERYKITGTAWLDANKDGKRDEEESLLSNMEIILINKKDSSIVKDVDSNENKIVKTDANGKYEFTNLVNGEYIVVFLYNSSKYNLTTYRKTDIDESINSDAVNIDITLNGTKQTAAISDAIKISDRNIRDIDIGIYEAEKFDLQLDKYISKITLTTPTIGTKTYTYNNEKITKIEVLSKNVDKSTIVIEYKIVVTNKGGVAGYAKKIVDYLPKDVGFSTEINKDWYLSENGNVYNTSLENEKINPGESKEITLVLTKKITENSIGTLNNTAEIYESYNEFGLEDINSKAGNKAENENDLSKADIVLSVVTGKVLIYPTIAILVIAMLGFGLYEIKKRVLNK